MRWTNFLTCRDMQLDYAYRYSNWLSAGLAARKAGNTGSNPVSEWSISAIPDDFVYVRIVS